MNYYFNRIINVGFEEAVERITQSLKNKGFGIITEIDLKATFKKKLNEDFRKYKILGACNPNYAFNALEKEDKIGTMLPCNVIVQEKEDGKVEIAAVNPVASMMAVENEALLALAGKVAQLLKEAVEAV